MPDEVNLLYKIKNQKVWVNYTHQLCTWPKMPLMMHQTCIYKILLCMRTTTLEPSNLDIHYETVTLHFIYKGSLSSEILRGKSR